MKKITLTLLMLFITNFSFAHDNNVSHHVNMDNPAGLVNPDGYFEYMIIKGDYLWLIADNFYNNPFKWREIHEANPYIIDPNWIYPNNWLVIPNVFTDSSGNPIYSGVTETTGGETTTTLDETATTWEEVTEIDLDGDGVTDGIDLDGDGIIDEEASIDLDGDGVIDGYDTDGDGQIDIAVDDASTFDKDIAATAEAAEAKAAEEAAAAALAATTAPTVTTESDLKDMERDESSVKSYCGKPGWKLGVHAGYPTGGGPEDENLNLGLLLGTPVGVKVGPLSVGLGAGAFSYNFDNYYFGAGLLASLCLNDLFNLDLPVILQLHGVGFYVFGEDQGLGIGGIGSANVPLGDSPLSLGLYGALGNYYPDDNDYNWSNVGAVLFYSL